MVKTEARSITGREKRFLQMIVTIDGGMMDGWRGIRVVCELFVGVVVGGW